jgi:hypothetical protein
LAIFYYGMISMRVEYGVIKHQSSSDQSYRTVIELWKSLACGPVNWMS